MTLHPATNPADLYALMGANALLTHLKSVVDHLEKCGVTLTPQARVGLEEIEQCVLEHEARTNPVVIEKMHAGLEGVA